MRVDTPLPRHDAELQRPLEHFRAKTKRLKIHPLETALLLVVSLHFIFLPLAIGGMRVWSQWISFALAAAEFALALVPRYYTAVHTGANSFRLIMWPRAARFPLFWLGLTLLVLVTIQALNPSWEYRTDGAVWWMKRLDEIPWLPTGVHVPFELWGPWRQLLIYSTTWLTVCAIWVGFTRRRSVQALLVVISANGLALAGLGILQKVTPNGKMFWALDWGNASFFSSFVYKNHAGNYLDLALAVTCGLAAWYYLRGLRRLEKSNPAGVFAFFATCIAIAILVSYARGATLVMLAFLCVCVAVFLIHQLFVPNATRKPVVALALMAIFGYFMKTGLETLNSHEAWTRLRKGVEAKDTSLESRRVARQAALEMANAYWLRGAGAGSFGFLFPVYQQRYPEIFVADGHRLFWEHAHCDPVEIANELGLAGIVLLLATGGWLALQLLRGLFWQNPLSGCAVFGVLLIVVQSWWDFPFQCPAILSLSWALLVLAIMWTRFEEINAKA